MLLIPVFELQNGQCRVLGDTTERAGVTSGDPATVTRHWVQAGARRVHLRDVDGAQAGHAVNVAAVAAIAAANPGVPIQVNGDARDEETVQAYLEAGAQYVVIGTKAASAPHFVRDLCLEFPGHILLELTATDGKLTADGWSKMQNQDAAALAAHFEQDGVEGFLYTDNDAQAAARLAGALTVPVIAATPISDLRVLRALVADGLAGVLLGAVLRAKGFDLTAAQARADQTDGV